MKEVKNIIINKNRGWRGLAEVGLFDLVGERISTMIFSFSQPVWEDMLKGYIVTKDQDNYYLIHFNHTEMLPRPTQQRSVLIKNFLADVEQVFTYDKNDWRRNAPLEHWDYIDHFIRNRNNHTTSDWNCIGVRVYPST